MLVPVWVVCGLYGVMTDNIFTRERDRQELHWTSHLTHLITVTRRPCDIQEDPDTLLWRLSVMVSIVLPVILGPLITFILYCGVSLVSLRSLTELPSSLGLYLLFRKLKRKVGSDNSVAEDVCCLSLLVRSLSSSSSLPPLTLIIILEVVVHLGLYIPSLVWCDQYLQLPRDIFPFVMVKYGDCALIIRRFLQSHSYSDT